MELELIASHASGSDDRGIKLFGNENRAFVFREEIEDGGFANGLDFVLRHAFTLSFIFAVPSVPAGLAARTRFAVLRLISGN